VSLETFSDSGPFIHLWQIGQLQLLTMFHRLLTTEQVVAEIIAPERLRGEDLATLPFVTDLNCAVKKEAISTTVILTDDASLSHFTTQVTHFHLKPSKA